MLTIREEEIKDYNEVERVVEESFKAAEFSDKNEHNLVKKLRKSNEFVKELSLIAEEEDKILGHVLLTKALINGENTSFETLALAPLAVLPEYQKSGIGKILMNKAIERARELGYKSIVVLGHENYYPKFGFEKASKYGVKAPFEVPDEAYMILELLPGGLNGVSGIVEYSKMFFQ